MKQISTQLSTKISSNYKHKISFAVDEVEPASKLLDMATYRGFLENQFVRPHHYRRIRETKDRNAVSGYKIVCLPKEQPSLRKFKKNAFFETV